MYTCDNTDLTLLYIEVKKYLCNFIQMLLPYMCQQHGPKYHICQFVHDKTMSVYMPYVKSLLPNSPKALVYIHFT